MTKEILIILACVPLYVINAFCDKITSSRNSNKYNCVYNCIKFLLCSMCMLPLLFTGNGSIFATGNILCGVACGIMYAVSKTVMLKGYEQTSVAFMTLCHSSGMILPCILGHFLWNEKISAMSIIGIVLAIVSIILLKGGNDESRRLSAAGALFGIIIFLTSAGVMIAQKLMALYFFDQSIGAYNFYSFIVAFLILCCFVKLRQVISAEPKDKKVITLCAAGSAISLSMISFVMTTMAKSVPSVILFPLFNGSGIIFVCIGSAFVFKERITIPKAIGLALGVLGLCLVNL